MKGRKIRIKWVNGQKQECNRGLFKMLLALDPIGSHVETKICGRQSKIKAYFLSMTETGIKKERKKRKQVDDEVLEPDPFSRAVSLEILSDEEDGVGMSDSDDGEVDEFPEIDTRSDSEDEEYEGSEDGSDGEDDEESSAVSDVDSDLHIFPESKTIISNITGQPKRVYPEIEPDYDSDSSTDDV
jgi:ribosome biogenesis protein ERB1